MSQTVRNLSITEAEETALVEMIKYFNDLGLPDDINSEDYDTLCEKICEPAFWEYSQTIHKLTQDPLQKGSFCVYNVFMFNPNTTFNPALPYAVVCASAPHENTVFKTLDECWGLCLDLSEEYGHSEVWYGKCLMGEYRNGQ